MARPTAAREVQSKQQHNARRAARRRRLDCSEARAAGGPEFAVTPTGVLIDATFYSYQQLDRRSLRVMRSGSRHLFDWLLSALFDETTAHQIRAPNVN